MKKIFLIITMLIFITLLSKAQFFTPNGKEVNPETLKTDGLTEVIREYSDTSGDYLIKFYYNESGPYMIPSTNPPGQRHYFSIVLVYRIEQGNSIPFGHLFTTEWTKEPCWENMNTDMIKRALQNK